MYQEGEEGPGAALAIWDATTGKQLTAFPGLFHEVVVWSPEGTRLVSGSASGPALVQVWEARTGRELFRYAVASQDNDAITAVAWSPDGTALAAATTFHQTVLVWQVPATP